MLRASEPQLLAEQLEQRLLLGADYSDYNLIFTSAIGTPLGYRNVSRSFKAAFGESPYSYLMTRRIERTKALLRRGDISVTDACFAVGSTSLGSFSSRFSSSVSRPAPIARAATRRPRTSPIVSSG